MACISAVCTSVPEHRCDNDTIARAGDLWLSAQAEKRALFLRFVESSQTNYRNFVLPPFDILRLNGAARRAELFQEHAPDIAAAALSKAMLKADIRPAQAGSLVFTSCSCPAIPSVDALLIDKLGLRSDIRRLPIYQHGCAGGIIGLSLAKDFVSTDRPGLLCSVELCSLVFQANDTTTGHLVGSAIFGDGAAAVVVEAGDTGLVFVDAQSFLVPGTRHLMGYDILDDGSHLLLDKELPKSLAGFVPGIVRDFLLKHKLTPADVPWWLFHPGGVKILNCLEEGFNLDRKQTHWARDVLRDNGNMSSATILFVLSKFMEDRVYAAGDYVLALGVGPGLTVELVLLRYVE